MESKDVEAPAKISLPVDLLERIRAERKKRAEDRERNNLAKNLDQIRSRCQTFVGFVKEAWHVVEPEKSLVWGIHMDAICLHLEAVSKGDITRLLINVPPGSSKSLLVSVLWPAWEWGVLGRTTLRYITTSYNDGPVKRDTRKSRDLILSEWYKSLWPHVVLTRHGETSFANSNTGTREGVPFGSLTSQRGDRLIIDDPHSTETAESAAERTATTRKFREGAINRLNDQAKSAIIIIMQRLNELDITGIILSLKMNYVHLMLPLEFEPERKCRTSIGYADPRKEYGDLLDPIRMPRDVVETLKRETTAYAYASQYQQRPAPREGGLFKRAWFEGKFVRQAPPGTTFVRHWDLAATRQGNGARTAGVKIGKGTDNKFYVSHVVKEREDGGTVRSIIRSTAELDGKDCYISLPQDPGQAGKIQAQDMTAMLAGYKVHAEPETGDKYTRAEPFAAQCEIGNVYLVMGEWNQDYLDEITSFPNSALKDQVDASSGAFARLNNIKKTLRFSQDFVDDYARLSRR